MVSSMSVRGVCPVVERTGLVSLCLMKGEESQELCGGSDTVKRVVFPRNFVNNHKDVDPCPSMLGVCPVVELTGLGCKKIVANK